MDHDMSCSSSTISENERPRPKQSTHASGNTRASNILDPGPCPEREQEYGKKKQSVNEESQNVPASLRSAANADENEETVIRSIRAADIAVGLKRLPAGFYVVVQHGGHEWRTENKPVSVNDDNVEWEGPITIPSDLSAIIRIAIYASVEFQPVLGNGEQLRELTTSVGELVDRGAQDLPFTFSLNEGDVVSSCSSILLSVGRRTRETIGSSVSRFADTRQSTTKLPGELEEATNQGHSALSRYRKYEDKSDLERSIGYFEHALNICSLSHPCRAAAQSNLAMAKFIHCQTANDDPSFDVPLALYRDALAARPVGHLDRPSTLVQLAVVHFARFQKLGDNFDATQSKTLLHEAVTVSPAESHEKRAAISQLQLQAKPDVGRFQPSGTSFTEGFTSGLMGKDLWNASVELLERYEQSRDLAGLEQAISLLEEFVQSSSVVDKQHPMGLTHLGDAFAHRFERLGELKDLEQSISNHKEAVGLSLDDDPDKSVRLCHLGGTLFLHFRHFGELGHLEEAIARLKQGVDLSPDGHPVALNHLGLSYLSRFERLGDLGDLEEAILILKNAVALTPDSHPHKPAVLTNLSNSFSARFERYGELCDLQQAISKQTDALDLTPNNDIRRASRLDNLGSLMGLRFQRLGDLNDLEQAIFRFKDTVDLTPHGHPHEPNRLNNLGMSYLTRFERLGKLLDLSQALTNLAGAFDLLPDGHPDKHRFLSNLSVIWKRRFMRLGELSDIDEAISMFRKVIYLTPNCHPDKRDCLNNLGESLRIRFARLGTLNDLEQAILWHTDAIDLTPDGHPDKPIRLNNLGDSFLARFRRLEKLSDLEQAISRYTGAVDLTPDSHPGKLRSLCNLGSAFLYRWERLRELRDVEQAMSSYSRAASDFVGPATVRFKASEQWIECARTLEHSSLLHAYSSAIDLLPQLAWTGLSLTDRFDALPKGANLVREAAAAALDAGQPETAVEWLEEGQSVVWEELCQLRSTYEELSSTYPDHARRLRELSVALEHASIAHEKSFSSRCAMKPVEQDKRRMLAISRDKVLQVIRELPGFERFLLHKEFSQLRASANCGPVVILNAAKTRCDALIVFAKVDHVVPLPNFTLEQSEGLQNKLNDLLGPTFAPGESVDKLSACDGVGWESILSSLWNDIVKPVLDALNFSVVEQTPGNLRRIFWFPTGPFRFLPVHAAGLYGDQYTEPGHKASDFVVSSYVPNLTLLACHTQPGSVSAGGGDLRLLAVHQSSSDGQPQLQDVDTELEHIRTVIQNSPSARATLIEPSLGTVEDVLELMQVTDWVHFAHQGIQDSKFPGDSRLCLADQCHLKLSDIISVSRPRSGLAFLSACQTATGHTVLSDVAAGMLFAGYRGVISTMWSIHDRLAPSVTKDVYEQLFRNDTLPDCCEAARALHDAMGRFRDSNASFVEWVPFIHVGL